MKTLYDVVFGHFDGDELIEEFDTYLAAKAFFNHIKNDDDDYDFILLRRIEIDEHNCEDIDIIENIQR